MKPTTFIFVYGRLEVGEDLEPSAIKSSTKDTITGECYDLGEYPAAINIGHSHYFIRGETLEIEESELADLDDVEGGEDYKRIKVVTELGYDAWVYQWIRAIPDSAKLITSWEDSDDSKSYRKNANS